MTADEFLIHLQQMPAHVQDTINNDLPVVMGKAAVDFFKENFHDEGFTDGTFKVWSEVNRRLDPSTRGARATRKILTGESGDLGESVQYKVTGPGEATITEEAYSKNGFNYAPVHNNGVADAGRNRNVTIPQRQSIGESLQLNEIIREEIELKLGSVVK